MEWLWVGFPVALSALLATWLAYRDEPNADGLLGSRGERLFGALVGVAVCQISVGGTLFRFPLHASDFEQVCAAIGAARELHWEEVPVQRGLFLSLLPAIFAEFLGLVDGMLVLQTLTQFGLLFAVGTWANSVEGGRAALIALAMVCVLEPTEVLVRNLTFYPQTLTVLVALGAVVSSAIRWPTLGRGVVGVSLWSLAALLDVRSLPWLWVAAPLLLFVGWQLPGKHRALFGLLGLCVLTGSWRLAAHWVPEASPGFEEQMLLYLDEWMRRYGQSYVTEVDLDTARKVGFLWGHRWGAWIGLDSFARLISVSQRFAGGAALQPLGNNFPAEMGLGPWLVVSVLAVIATAAQSWRRREFRVLLQLGMLLPMFAGLVSAMRGIQHVRYLALGVPFIAIGFALFVRRWYHAMQQYAVPGSARWQRGRWVSARVEWIVLLVALLVLRFAVPPSMGPRAVVRGVVWADEEPNATFRRIDDPELLAPCRAQLHHDRDRGRSLGGRWLGADVFGPSAPEQRAVGAVH